MSPNLPNHRKSRGEFRSLFHRILQFAIQGLNRVDFLREVAGLLLEFSGADEVELRLIENLRYYRCRAVGDGEPRLESDTWALMHTETGERLPAQPPTRDADFERLCRNMLRAGSAPSIHHAASGELTSGSDSSPESEDFLCRLILPVSVEQRNIGLLILRSRRPDFLSPDEVSFYESLAENLGVALAHRRTQVALRERVKELTCLYGIARLGEQPEIPLPELLQRIVELLPPAWFFPEIAEARILLNGAAFATTGFREGAHRQMADIVIQSKIRGSVELVYLEERPELDEGPFLKEERSLIDTIARELALMIERRQAEEDKARLQEQLRHADRLATIGQLAAGVAHELNEPLGNILGFAQLARRAPRLSDQVSSDLEKIINASLFAREVIRKLMLFARQAPSRKASVDLNRVVEESLTLLESRLAKSGIELRRALAPDLPCIAADPAQLSQVLVNLVVNAVQAMPRGGVLTLSTAPADPGVSLVVEDTGAGMSAEVMQRIFLPFFTTKDIDQGTGLGLSVVHGIVTAHGGSIEVESRIGEGSRFTIRLPAAPPESTEQEHDGNVG